MAAAASRRRDLNPSAAEFRPSSGHYMIFPQPSTFFLYPHYYYYPTPNPQPPPPPPPARRLPVPFPRTHRRRRPFPNPTTTVTPRPRLPSCRRDLSTSGVLVRRQTPPVPVTPGGAQTSVMIRNIPNQYTRKMLIKFLDEFCKKENDKIKNSDVDEAVEFDFVYLPIDFRTKMNRGYAFVNFTKPAGVMKMVEANRKDQSWGFCDSLRKRREIAVAKLQGKDAFVKHFELSSFACDSDEFLPVCFSPPRDGSNKEVSQRNIGHQRHSRQARSIRQSDRTGFIAMVR